MTYTLYPTKAKALAAARKIRADRIVGHTVTTDQATGLFVGVVILDPTQAHLKERVRDGGCVAAFPKKET